MVHFVGCQGVACRALMIDLPRCSRGWTNGNRQTSTWSIQQDYTQTTSLGLTSPGIYHGLGLVWFMLTLTRSHTSPEVWLPVHQQACLRTAPRMRACGLLLPSWFMTSRLRHIAPGESGDSLGTPGVSGAHRVGACQSPGPQVIMN